MQKSRKAMRTKGDQESQKRRHASRCVAFGLIILGAFSVVVCGYGHAALSTSLQISGEATVKNSAGFKITYMQEMTPEICANAETGVSQQLLDMRDNKSYWVAKMADNKCWMTQNLALDLTTEGLTSELSDIQPASASAAGYTVTTNAAGKTIYVWNKNSKYPPQNTVATAFAQSATSANYVAAKSSSGGAKYIIDEVGRYSSTTSEKVSSYSQAVWAKNVEGWSPTYVFDPSKSNYTYDRDSQTYDAHFLIGNLYQIGAATAGSSTTSGSPNIPQSSICPKGWMLPQATTNSSDFRTLLTAYGFSSTATNGSDISLPPLYLIRGGGNTTSSQFSNIGRAGFWWAARSNSAAYQMILEINANTVESIKSSVRNTGRSIRCVLR